MVARPDRSLGAAWRKSRFSNEAGECVEIAARNGSVLVRDSRDELGGILAVTGEEWGRLVDRIVAGDLDCP